MLSGPFLRRPIGMGGSRLRIALLATVVGGGCGNASGGPNDGSTTDVGGPSQDGEAATSSDDAANDGTTGNVDAEASSSCPLLESLADASLDAGARYVAEISLQNDLCLPSAFAFDPACRLIVLGMAHGCDGTGLETAGATDLEAIAPHVGTLLCATAATDICLVPEVFAESSATTCASDREIGWCHVNSACTADAAACSQALCATQGFRDDFEPRDGSAMFGYSAALIVCP
jgi:hypothetical protein